MIFIDELKNNILYKKPFHLPIVDTKNRKYYSCIFLLSPSLNASIYTLNHPLIINKKYFESYYIEKDLTVYANKGLITEDTTTTLSNPELAKPNTSNPNIGGNPDMTGTSSKITKKENSKIKDKKEKESYIGLNNNEYQSEDTHLRFTDDDGNDTLILFDKDLLLENDRYNTVIKKILYKERYKNNAEVYDVYDYIKKMDKDIKYTYLSLAKYKSKNVFIDLFNYLNAFNLHNIYKMEKGLNLYVDFIQRLLSITKLNENYGYLKTTVFVPLKYWAEYVDTDEDIFDFSKSINPISMIYRLTKMNPKALDSFKHTDFLFLGDHGYFKLDLTKFKSKDLPIFKKNIYKLLSNSTIIDNDPNNETSKAIEANIISKLEDNKNVKIHKLTGDKSDKDKKEVEEIIKNAASTSKTTEDALDKINQDDVAKMMIADLIEDENEVKITAARASRMSNLNDKFKYKKIDGTSIDEILKAENEPLPETALNIDTINDDWSHLTYTNFEKNYSVDDDILLALYSLSEKTYPLAVKDIKVEDTSTSEDLKETYTVQFEDINGDRFTFKFDVPLIKDGKFMMLRGNDKTINGQLTQIPIVKTDENTVQIVSNYNKIIMSRYGSNKGKSVPSADILMKTLPKYNEFKLVYGDNSRVCSKYEVPMDYIDISSVYTSIETKDIKIYFNLDTMIKDHKDLVDLSKGIPLIYLKKTKEVLYYNHSTDQLSNFVLQYLCNTYPKYRELVDSTKVAKRYSYTKASILNSNVPLMVILSYNIGLIQALDKADIIYNISEKRVKPTYNTDVIKFNDAYLSYNVTYSSSLLMNGLKECNTEDYSIKEVNQKLMWIDMIEKFGPRIIADGLDNFYDLMIDPITKEVLEYYNLPTDYIDVLIYASNLLADNKYIRHTDMSGRRYRSNELVAGYTYKCIAQAYEQYSSQMRRSGKGKMSMKQSKVLDLVMVDPTCSDLSVLNDLLTVETANTVGYKGLSGLNQDRAYGVDKRKYDDSMLNVLGLSTSFAGNVGVTRQTTLDMNIEGKRGYIKPINNDTDQMSVAKSFTATEAIMPYGTTRDDPMRSAMTFIQTSKHGMRIKKAMPMLISNGADQALPLLSSNTFSFKAAEDGKIIERTEDYLILEYKSGNHEFVDLRNIVKKNSNGGFFASVKLDSDMKEGHRFKAGDVLAYDKLSYNTNVGENDNIAYSLGNLSKMAMMITDESYEDSFIISEYLSEALSSEVVVMKDISLPKNTNVYKMIQKGQAIQEGEPLIIFQNAFEEEDVNSLLKNLVDDPEEISDLGRIRIKSKVTGWIEDIKIYRTCEKDEMSDSLKKIVNKYEKSIKDLEKTMKKYDIVPGNRLEASDKLENTGKVKNLDDGVLIEFYLKYDDKLSIGDKLVPYSAIKGTVKEIFPVGDEPYTDFRPDEPIDRFIGQFSVQARMTASNIIVGSINKALIELDRKVKEMAGIPWKSLHDMQ